MNDSGILKFSQLLVAFELDNANSVSNSEIAKQSFESVMQSAIEFKQFNAIPVTIFIITSDTPAELLRDFFEEKERITDVNFQYSVNDSHSYFGTKNVMTAFAGNNDVIVFCDSDCVYEKHHLQNMVKALTNSSASVVYGMTYANLFNATSFQSIAALCWQFPPESIGYVTGWGGNRWANNLAVRSLVLKSNPFPDLQISRLRNAQLKIERVLWEETLIESGLEITEVDSKCWHLIFDSSMSLLQRHFIHGVARSTRAKLKSDSFQMQLLGTFGFVFKRALLLIQLCLRGRVSIQNCFGALGILFGVGIFRLGGFIITRGRFGITSRQ